MTQHIVEVPTGNVPRIRIIYDFVSPAEENYLVQVRLVDCSPRLQLTSGAD